jgi:hypothetical protein
MDDTHTFDENARKQGATVFVYLAESSNLSAFSERLKRATRSHLCCTAPSGLLREMNDRYTPVNGQ